MKLINYYLAATLLPAILSGVLMLTVSSIFNSDYESEWLTKESVIVFDLIMSFICSVVYAILALTIFMNLKQVIKDNMFLSILSWFFLPFAFMVVILYFTLEVDSFIQVEQKILYSISLTLPHAVCFVLSYVIFRRKIWLSLSTNKQ